MTYTSADNMLLSSRDVCFPMPSLALAPAAFYLGAHMLKCLQEVNLKTGCGEKSARRLPRGRTLDKSTQTVASFAQKKVQGRRTPTKGATRRTESKTSVDLKTGARRIERKTSGENLKTQTRRIERKTSGEDLKTGTRRIERKTSGGDLKAGSKRLEKKTSGEDLKTQTRRIERRTSGEDLKTVRSACKTVCETKPSIRSSKSETLRRRCSLENKNVKTEVKKTEVENQKSGMSSSNLKSRPTKGSMTKDRRLSTGDCPKRTSESCAEMDRAKWLKNPVYASDGESDGRRTDRSDMSPPWLDISAAKEVKTSQLDQKTVASPSVLDLAKTAARHVPARIRSTQPKMEVVPEASREINLRKDGPPVPMVPSAVSRVLSDTDRAIRQTIERKLGKPLSEVDTASLKSISERRMKELTEKYARNRPDAKPLVRDIPASIVARLHPRARDSADSICQKTVDPQRGRVVV